MSASFLLPPWTPLNPPPPIPSRSYQQHLLRLSASPAMAKQRAAAPPIRAPAVVALRATGVPPESSAGVMSRELTVPTDASLLGVVAGISRGSKLRGAGRTTRDWDSALGVCQGGHGANITCAVSDGGGNPGRTPWARAQCAVISVGGRWRGIEVDTDGRGPRGPQATDGHGWYSFWCGYLADGTGGLEARTSCSILLGPVMGQGNITGATAAIE
ncbi:hypothetical protein BD779DRAFT_1736216 [Infundibulicybe gibba]|nr:hypothetical protein BD779DRAFT_1736216 [Infundibulicybe gibba]